MSFLSRATHKGHILLFCGSALLWVSTALLYWRQADVFAAFTLLPIWVWGLHGAACAWISWYFGKIHSAKILLLMWLGLIILKSDEMTTIWHCTRDAPTKGFPLNFNGKPALRVITLNCSNNTYGNPAQDIATWQPDILLLQEVNPHTVPMIAKQIFGEKAYFKYDQTNATISRYPIARHIRNQNTRHLQLSLVLPSGELLELVNIHLASATTDLRYWKRTTWEGHCFNRRLRRFEIETTLGALNFSTQGQNRPCLLGGDFNTSGEDIVHQILKLKFQDAFQVAGAGWGNTFHRRIPIVRIDRLYTSQHLKPVRCTTSITKTSDHKMVIADYVATKD